VPDVSTLVIVGAGWGLLLVAVWALCAAAGRGDAEEGVTSAEVRSAPAVVADTGAIRAWLQDALGELDADGLTVTVRIDERDAVLASARPVVEAAPGRWPQLAVPVRVGGRTVAMLRAARRPGRPRFGAADMFALHALAARVAGAMESAQPSSVPVDEPSAMA
jgi:hypothetical protein